MKGLDRMPAAAAIDHSNQNDIKQESRHHRNNYSMYIKQNIDLCSTFPSLCSRFSSQLHKYIGDRIFF